ncbi:TonB-dependent receptor [Marivirga salinae]|uniref:TonB-dependent receptor n=1 Tax=Marivirga salinarum TaxID=3059078 RepID=A0AA51NEA0_9BACT|nr:TonB-dependent receptor [Marivirga sp. BDSF4-3]WMN12550.1 TonB-dependent receptor [Marivirga sp. BDSF4-3]
MLKFKHLLAVLLILSTSVAIAQKGKIRGTIIEDSNGEPMIGANVVVNKVSPDNQEIIEGALIGAVTDLDGQFTVPVEAGTYNVKVSFVTFQALTIEGVVIKDGEVNNLGQIRLKEEKSELQEVVVTAKAIRTTEAALMTVKKKAPGMMDGISSAKFKLIGDATAVEAVKRVTGVSIEGGKYVYVRGLGDRYTKTTLNGMDVPGLDPDRNSLQMDIFPTSLIDNMIVRKSFTADLPADFTGGIVNVETKDFPDEKIMDVSFGIGFNPSMHFNSDYLTYEGGSTDFLGFDDGTRALPQGARATQVPGPFTGNTEEASEFIRSFNPNLAAQNQTSLMDYSLGFSIGDQLQLGKSEDDDKPKLGYIFSLSYKNNTRFYDDVSYGEYQKYKDPERTEMRYATTQDGQLGENNVLIGALGGLALKSKYTKLRLTAMRLQNGESRAGQFNIQNDGEAVGQSGYVAESDNLEYTQSALNNILLNGTHILKNTGWDIDWRVSPTFSTLEDPDIRKTAFSAVNTDNPRFAAGEAGNPSRIWRSLNEFNINSKIDITKKYSFNDADAKFKFGGSHTYKNRDYEILFFDVQFFESQSWPNPSQEVVLNEENLFPSETNGIYYQSGNNNPNPNAYSSNVNNTAFYVSNEMTPIRNFKTVLGLRVENYVQRHTGRDQAHASGSSNGRNLVNEKVLDSFDFFPTANLIYSLTDDQNLRASYSKTIARPSFKELSFAQILDPITNRIFNGSLFTYADWDGNLTETRIDNIDLRWELFQREGQMFSVSAFYKYFDNPIELVRIPAQQTSTEFQARNVGNGRLLGVELEARKKLDFISPALRNFNISGNLTMVESRIDMTDQEFNARKEYEKTGENISDVRQMAGQAPYVINGGLSYNNPVLGLNAGMFYNVKGPTLAIVGTGLYGDVYDESFHNLSFSINKTFGKDDKTSIDFKVSNILNDKRESFYQSFQADKEVFTSLNPGTAFSVGVNYKF